MKELTTWPFKNPTLLLQNLGSSSELSIGLLPKHNFPNAQKGATPKAIHPSSVVLQAGGCTELSPTMVYGYLNRNVIGQPTPSLRDLDGDNHGSRSGIIHRIPMEVVGYIFSFIAKDNDFSQVLCVCGVSSRWRAIALATPALWNHLSIDTTSRSASNNDQPRLEMSALGGQRLSLNSRCAADGSRERYIRHPNLVCLWVSRAKALPLHLHLKWSPRPEMLSAWLDIFTSMKDQLESLRVVNYVRKASIEQLFYIRHQESSVARSFSRLRILEFFGSPFADDDRFHQFGRYQLEMPKLRSIMWHQPPGEKHTAIDWSSLPEIISLSTNEHGLVAFRNDEQIGEGLSPTAAKFLSLEVKLSASRLGGSATINRPMAFASLRHLTIQDGIGGFNREETLDLLRATWVPNLITLTFSNSAFYPCHLPHVTAILGTHLPRCPDLAVLDLDNVSFHANTHNGLTMAIEHFKRVFRVVPNLVTLRLQRMPVQEILAALTRDDDEDVYSHESPTISLLPKLRDLTLEKAVDQVTLGHIEPFMRYRGLISRATLYPPQPDKRCAPLISLQVEGVQWAR